MSEEDCQDDPYMFCVLADEATLGLVYRNQGARGYMTNYLPQVARPYTAAFRAWLIDVLERCDGGVSAGVLVPDIAPGPPIAGQHCCYTSIKIYSSRKSSLIWRRRTLAIVACYRPGCQLAPCLSVPIKAVILQQCLDDVCRHLSGFEEFALGACCSCVPVYLENIVYM